MEAELRKILIDNGMVETEQHCACVICVMSMFANVLQIGDGCLR